MARFTLQRYFRECVRRFHACSNARTDTARRRIRLRTALCGTIGTELLDDRRLLSATHVVTPVNHPPVGTSGTVASVVNTPYLISASAFGFTDPNDSPPNSFTGSKITLLPTAGTLTDNGTPLTVNQFIPVADMNAGRFVFTPNSNLSGGPFFMCKFQVADNGGTGTNLDTTAKVLDITLRQPNHPPVGKSNTLNANVNMAFVFKVSNFGFSDPNDSPPDKFIAVKFNILPNAGKITDNGVALTAGQVVSTADITAGKLVFTPTTNLKGGPYFLCKFQVEDSGGSAGGGSNIDPKGAVLDVRLLVTG